MVIYFTGLDLARWNPANTKQQKPGIEYHESKVGDMGSKNTKCKHIAFVCILAGAKVEKIRRNDFDFICFSAGFK